MSNYVETRNCWEQVQDQEHRWNSGIGVVEVQPRETQVMGSTANKRNRRFVRTRLANDGRKEKSPFALSR